MSAGPPPASPSPRSPGGGYNLLPAGRLHQAPADRAAGCCPLRMTTELPEDEAERRAASSQQARGSDPPEPACCTRAPPPRVRRRPARGCAVASAPATEKRVGRRTDLFSSSGDRRPPAAAPLDRGPWTSATPCANRPNRVVGGAAGYMLRDPVRRR